MELMGVSRRTTKTQGAYLRRRDEDETILGGWDVSRHTAASLRRWIYEQELQLMSPGGYSVR